jgi:hypothetical protein
MIPSFDWLGLGASSRHDVTFNFPRFGGRNDARLGVAGAAPQPVIALNDNFFFACQSHPVLK